MSAKLGKQFLHGGSAACYLAAGRADAAFTILEDTTAATSTTLARDRGHLVQAGRSHHLHGPARPGMSSQLGQQALSIASDTGSARIMRELRTRDPQLTERWPSHPESRAFRDALVA